MEQKKLSLSELDKAIELEPQNPKNYLYRSSFHIRQGDPGKALEDINKAIELEPQNPKNYLYRSDLLTFQGDPDKALDDINKAIELEPQNYLYRSSFHIRQGDPDKALDDINKAIELEPQNPKNYLYRSRFHIRQGDPGKTLEDINKAIELEPQNPKNYLYRSDFLTFQDDFDKALDDTNKAIELEPQNPKNYLKRSDLLTFQGDFDKALDDTNKAIELEPQNPKNYSQRSSIHIGQGDPDKALDDINKAIELDSQNPQNYSQRSNIHQLQDDPDKALDDINKAIELNPSNVIYYFIRGLFYIGQEKYKEALKDYTQVNKSYSGAKFLGEDLFIASEMREDHKGFRLLLKLSRETQSLMRQIHKHRSSKYKFPETQEVSHYTSDKILKSIFNDGFRFYDVKYLNDTLEGNVFFDLLEIEKENKKKIKTLLFSSNRSFNHSTFIGSFTTSEHDKGSGIISMWRTYGNGGKGSRSAGGSMLCWNRMVFSENLPGTKFHLLHKFQDTSEHSGEESFNRHIEKEELFLLPVIYADVPEDLKPEDEKQNPIPLRHIKEILEEILALHDSDKRTKDMNQNLIALTRLMVDKIRFLFKSKQYDYELEERVVVSRSRSLPVVKLDESIEGQDVPPGRLYIAINPSYFTPHKVVLGPTNTRMEEWDKCLNGDREENKRIKVKKSKIKFKESA